MPSSNTDVEKFIIDGADFPIVDPTARTAIGTTFNNTGTNISATTTEGAIKEVNNSLTQKKTTATLPENVYSNVGINQVERSGNTVIVTLGLTITSSIAGVNGLIATLPVGYRPSARVNLPCYGTYYSTNVGFWKVFISSDGTIKTDIGSGTLTGTIYINFSFTV